MNLIAELRRRNVIRMAGLYLQEQSCLAQLRDEIVGNHGVVDLRMQYTSQVVAAGERALAYPGLRQRGEVALAAVSGTLRAAPGTSSR